ncbi:MAG: peroxidase family protein [Bdellovibrionota bacterium]
MKIRIIPLMVVSLALLSCARNTEKTIAKKAVVDTNRVPTSQDKETPWTTWSKKGTVGGLLVLKHIREELLEKNLHDPHIDYTGYAKIECPKEPKFRTADGTCYLPETPYVGAANTAFGRNVPPEFIDAVAAEKLMTPNPKGVSQEFFTRQEFQPVPFLNMLAASWIQFMNHDWLTHGKNVEKNPHSVHGTSEVVERTDTVNDKEFKKEYGKVSNNQVTHWWDGSQIYGSNQNEQNAVRSFAKGKLATVIVNGRELLPKGQLNVAYNKQNQGYEVTGFRDNFWVGLSMLHHLFVKEHNAIADMLYTKYVKVDKKSGKFIWRSGKHQKLLTEKEVDEEVFQTARLINAAVMAKIHTVEWTPAILANKVLKKAMFTNWYGLAHPQTWSRILKYFPMFSRADFGLNAGYTLGGIVGDKRNDYGVPYTITEEFTSVYRLHSLLPEALELKRYSDKKAVSVPMEATRNEKSYDMMSNYDLKDLFYSFGTQHPGQLILGNFPKFMQELKIPGHGTMDLGMIDIVRDRERGVPRYNQFRRALNMRPIQKYSDFFMDGEIKTDKQREIIAKFNKVYGKDEDGKDNVEMVDLLVGTLAEEVRPTNFGFGETMFHIFILMASRRLMADPYYTDRYNSDYYTKAGIHWVDTKSLMSQVISRHMPELKKHMKGDTAFNPWTE